MADPKGEGVKVGFDGSIRLEFHGAKVTSDAGLLAYRDLDEALGLFDSVPFVFHDSRTGRNIQHHLTALLRQSVYSRLAGYEDVNDAHRLSVDPTMRRITGKKLDNKNAASANTMGRFETQMPSVEDNLKPFRKSMADGWKERCRKQLIDASFWIWTVQPVRSMASKKPLPTTAISDALATIPCFASTSSEIAKVPCFGPATCTVRTVGRSCWNQSWLGTRGKQSANTFGVMPPSPSQRFMNTWRRRAFCMPSGFPPTRCFKKRSNTC